MSKDAEVTKRENQTEEESAEEKPVEEQLREATEALKQAAAAFQQQPPPQIPTPSAIDEQVERVVGEPPKPPEFPPLSEEELTPAQLVQEMEKRQRALLEYQERKLQWEREKEQRRKELEEQQRMQQEEVARIQKFLADHPDLRELAPEIQQYYGKPFTIEQAYEYVKFKRAAKKAQKSSESDKRPEASSLRPSETTRQPVVKHREIKTVKDAVEAAFDELGEPPEG